MEMEIKTPISVIIANQKVNKLFWRVPKMGIFEEAKKIIKKKITLYIYTATHYGTRSSVK
jgi:hypothetical protein